MHGDEWAVRFKAPDLISSPILYPLALQTLCAHALWLPLFDCLVITRRFS